MFPCKPHDFKPQFIPCIMSAKALDNGVSKVLFLSMLMVLQTAVSPMIVQPGWSLSDGYGANGVIADGSDPNSAVGSTDDYTVDAVDLAANITDFDDDGIPDY